MLSKCCCCVPLRTGSLILAVLGILGGFGMMRTGAWYDILDGVLCLIAYGALLFGAIKYHQGAVLVNLVFSAITIVLGILFVIIALASLETFVPQLRDNCASIPDLNQTGMTCSQLKSITVGTVAGTYAVGSLLSIYFWFCNYSFYLELKKGGGNPA